MLFFNLIKKINSFSNENAKIFSIGKTTLNRDTLCVKVGRGRPVIIIQYAIHAREYITSYLALLEIERAIKNYKFGTIYFVPVANPDGVALCMDGIKSVEDEKKQKALLDINKSQDFSLWKANINAVDLNVNFPALWGQGAENTKIEGGANFIGKDAGSEKETQNLMQLTYRVKPDLTVSYHSKGEVIYYEFYQNARRLKRDKLIAIKLAKWTGYTLLPLGASSGGYKDWCIQEFKIPSFTIEVGADNLKHPLKLDDLPSIWRQNEFVVQNLLALL